MARTTCPSKGFEKPWTVIITSYTWTGVGSYQEAVEKSRLEVQVTMTGTGAGTGGKSVLFAPLPDMGEEAEMGAWICR